MPMPISQELAASGTGLVASTRIGRTAGLTLISDKLLSSRIMFAETTFVVPAPMAAKVRAASVVDPARADELPLNASAMKRMVPAALSMEPGENETPFERK